MSLGSPFYTTCIVFSLCCLCLNPHTYILLRVSCLVSSFLPSHPALLPTCVGQVRAPLSLADCSLLSSLRKYRPWLP
ncbi:uncharacterized protein CLUP02_02218 [Colletotrichum lupini]|uniref:Uncharacterized protein n=1 Tax=Colletotrichum lupini TaxID=145971 RepID=A0A9Q8W9W5_9PEZI|nr:uncharacterized protein CLUP02_02218 [Colletotrichum lupini]UQC75564.1 hypothetical protein CLUP02_02218 [Colletotrichum lupini]